MSVVKKMAALAEQGIDPFGKRFERTATSGQLKRKNTLTKQKKKFARNQRKLLLSQVVLMTKRGKGKLASPTSKTAMVKSKSTCVKMLSVKKNYENLQEKLTLVTSSVSKGEVMRNRYGRTF